MGTLTRICLFLYGTSLTLYIFHMAYTHIARIFETADGTLGSTKTIKGSAGIWTVSGPHPYVIVLVNQWPPPTTVFPPPFLFILYIQYSLFNVQNVSNLPSWAPQWARFVRHCMSFLIGIGLGPLNNYHFRLHHSFPWTFYVIIILFVRHNTINFCVPHHHVSSTSCNNEHLPI